jgi:uncharacterized delta-60 repeat protein
MKKLYLYITLAIIWFMAIAARAQQAGALDTTFSVDGKVITFIGSGYAEGRGVAIQADGKIVAGGHFYVSGSNTDFAIVRYTTEGILDNTFGNAGIASAGIGTNADNGNALLIQEDGKILIAGSTHNSNDNDLALVRFNMNGTLDNTFGSNGIVVTNLGAAVEGANAMVLQSDGKIIIGGTSIGNLSNADFALVRYNINGTPDSTFGYGGIVKTDINNSYDYVNALVMQEDGKIVACGTTAGPGPQDFVAVRYNTDGTLDNTFGSGGKAVTVVGAGTDEAFAALVQLDGKIVLAGASDAGNSNYDFAMVRLNDNGSLDYSFGSWGKVITSFGANDKGRAVILQTDGKIILAGSSVTGNNSDFAIARYNINGSLDYTFDYDGRATTDFGSGYDAANAIATQSDGSIVVCGTSLQTNNTFALARYIGNVNLAVPEKTKKEKLLVYFNTYSNELVVSGTEDKGAINVFDIIGNKVASSESSNKKTVINVGPVTPGVYLLNYENGKNSTGLRFVVR